MLGGSWHETDQTSGVSTRVDRSRRYRRGMADRSLKVRSCRMWANGDPLRWRCRCPFSARCEGVGRCSCWVAYGEIARDSGEGASALAAPRITVVSMPRRGDRDGMSRSRRAPRVSTAAAQSSSSSRLQRVDAPRRPVTQRPRPHGGDAQHAGGSSGRRAPKPALVIGQQRPWHCARGASRRGIS